ncbi:MAG: 3-dehydroquinate synthase II [Candidatus Bathyarchaeota archaeon]|nr:3-dehydroquinate synthase II [Candidatus Bathyarchaeota archaeon]
MRELWVKVDPCMQESGKKELIVKASQLSSALLVEPEDVELAKRLGAKAIVTSSETGDILLAENLEDIKKAERKGKKACIMVTVQSRGDEEKIEAAAEASADYVAVSCPDWKVIPLENLIAKVHGKAKLLALVSDHQEAKVALETLEMGVDGVVADVSDLGEIMRIHETMKVVRTREQEKESAEKIMLSGAKITEVKPLGSGARVCIDTCDLMKEGEGLLVGCQSLGLFLIEAEVHETPFVAPRPFRVNAGSIALYVLAPGEKTRYLSELNAGDEVLIVDREGRSRTANIGRVKIEWRPLLLVEAECEGRTVKTILQNAETIRVMTVDGSISVKDLKEGDQVLVRLEEGGRHFGTLVEEEKVIER